MAAARGCRGGPHLALCPQDYPAVAARLDVAPETIVIDPKCPTPEQKAVIEKNLKLYGAGFVHGYDPTPYAHNLLAMARTLGYPEPSLAEMNAVRRFLNAALKQKC